MIRIKRAGKEDLDFHVKKDLLGDGYTIDPNEEPLTDKERAAYRQKIEAFVSGTREAGWIALDGPAGTRTGMILVRFREVFQLWVAPEYRRRGIATRLKLHIEEETRERGAGAIYTHTEAQNKHVIELNRKLGYQMVRCGPLWDDTPRVSLIKYL